MRGDKTALVLVLRRRPRSRNGWWCMPMIQTGPRPYDPKPTIVAERQVVEDEDDDDCVESSIFILNHHRIAQYPYLLDFDFNHITGFEKSRRFQVIAHAARRAG